MWDQNNQQWIPLQEEVAQKISDINAEKEILKED